MYKTYEFLNDPEYIDQYCVDLSPHIVDRTGEERYRLWQISVDAMDNFDADSLGSRLFFKSDKARQKFLTWLLLKYGHDY